MPRRAVAAILLALVAAVLSGCFGGRSPIADNGARCLAELDADAVSYYAIDLGEAKDDARCRVDTPVRVARLDVALNQPATMSCRLAARLDAFERTAVQRIALADLGHSVSRIDHLGAYNCRRNTGRPDQLSEHAYGLAIDIAGFHLSDGTVVSVEHDWWRPSRKRDFLRHLAHSACSYFSVVLTPSSNRDHFNHMHFDIGPGRLCSV
jgi:hypothetical protein